MNGIKKHSHTDREKIVAEMVPLIKAQFGDNLVALAAQASYARGDDADYSDLELIAFLKEMPEGKDIQGMSRIRDGMLIELQWTTKELYLSKVKEPTEEWYIAGSDTLLPLINEEFITELNDYKIGNLKKKCLEQATRHWPEVQEAMTKLLNAIVQENRQGIPMLVFYLLKEALTSLSFLNRIPYTTLAKFIPEARTFKLKPSRFNEFLDLVTEGEYQNLRLLKELAISVFEELEIIHERLGCQLYDNHSDLKIEKTW
jgi:hypothetical protein